MIRAPSATRVSTVINAPPPASAPNATPLLRTFVRSTPKKTLILSPRSTEWITICLVAWSSARNSSAAIPPRRRGSRQRSGEGPPALDRAHDEPAHDRQPQHRHDRAQVEPARTEPHHRDEAPEDVQVRIGHL